MAQVEKLVHRKDGSILDSLSSGKSRIKLNVYSLSKMQKSNSRDKAEFTWGEGQRTLSGLEIYALRSDTHLVNTNMSINVDKALSQIFRNGPSKLSVFFDTLGSKGRERIQFSFYMFKLAAFTALRTLIYNASTYKQKRFDEVFHFLGKCDTPVESYRNLVVDLCQPINHFYIISYLHEHAPSLEPRYQYIASYDGDMCRLSEVSLCNVILDIGFFWQKNETEIEDISNEF